MSDERDPAPEPAPPPPPAEPPPEPLKPYRPNLLPGVEETRGLPPRGIRHKSTDEGEG
jgi:hypothetical protein